jgi:hypothetical protein
MPDEAGRHWFKFKICGAPAMQQQRIDKLIREVKDFHGAKTHAYPSLGYHYVGVWIPGKQAGDEFLECFTVNSFLFGSDGIKLVRHEWRPSN